MKNNLKNIFHYVIGNLRYKIYYSNNRNLIRQHILEQIEFRIKVMNQECYNKGYCIKCGCHTTALQMCSKSCEGNCYPKMMGKKLWNRFFMTGYPVEGWTHQLEIITGIEGNLLEIELLMFRNKIKFFRNDELD